MLQRVLRGRLTFTPRVYVLTGEPDGYEFPGPTRFDKLFTGITVDVGILGNEVIGPEDTFDGDDGRLLDAVCGKGSSLLGDATARISSFGTIPSSIASGVTFAVHDA